MLCYGNFKSLKNIKKFEVFHCLYQQNRQEVRDVGVNIQMMGDVGLSFWLMGDDGLSFKLMGDGGLSPFGLFFISFLTFLCFGSYKSLKNIKKFEVFYCLYLQNRKEVRDVGVNIEVMGDGCLSFWLMGYDGLSFKLMGDGALSPFGLFFISSFKFLMFRQL